MRDDGTLTASLKVNRFLVAVQSHNGKLKAHKDICHNETLRANKPQDKMKNPRIVYQRNRMQDFT